MSPLKKGFSPEVVSSNIKELVKSGRKPKQAVAIALANKRKYKKMAAGGELYDAIEEGEDQDEDEWDQSQRGMEYQEKARGGGVYHPDEHDKPHEYQEREIEMNSEHLGMGGRAKIGMKKRGLRIDGGGEVVGMADGGSPAIDPEKAKQMQSGATQSGWQPEQWKKNLKAGLGMYKGGVVQHEEPDLEFDKGEGDHNEGDDMGIPGRPYYSMDEDRQGLSDSVMLAQALHRNLQKNKYADNQNSWDFDPNDEVAGERMAKGGYMQDHLKDNSMVGNKPELEWVNDGTEEPMEDEDKREGDRRDEPMHPGRMATPREDEHAAAEPMGMGLSKEAKEALMRKKKSRRYGSYDPR